MRDPGDSGFAHIEHFANKTGAALAAVDDNGPLDWRVISRLDELCRQYRPAIWHGHDYKSNLIGLWLTRRHSMKLVTTAHGWVSRTWKTPFYYALDRLCLRHYDAVICVSQDIRDTCTRSGVPGTRCWLVPNAIDEEEFRRREPVSSAKARYGIDPNRLLIGAAGRLAEEKGFSHLIRAVKILRDDGVEVELWIAGQGPHERSLRNLVTEVGLDDRVSLLGQRADMLDLFQAMDVFVLSSSREGLPNVLLEAMALEVPVVCTRVAAVPNLVENEASGLLVDPGSSDALARAIERLQKNPELRARLARRARGTIEASYTFKHRMETIRRIYDQVLAGSSRASISSGSAPEA